MLARIMLNWRTKTAKSMPRACGVSPACLSTWSAPLLPRQRRNKFCPQHLIISTPGILIFVSLYAPGPNSRYLYPVKMTIGLRGTLFSSFLFSRNLQKIKLYSFSLYGVSLRSASLANVLFHSQRWGLHIVFIEQRLSRISSTVPSLNNNILWQVISLLTVILVFRNT